ncbi:MAG: hypothetical protein J7L45_01425, partial [Candidatus Aenigmarchaeota archaeon]|nr:hypothetical protein [Candidatus Aenigmarchaeota archaeon]
VDIFDEFDRLIDEKYELLTTDGVLRELKKLSEGSSRSSKAARLGLKFIKGKNIKVLKTKESYVDRAVLNLSQEFLKKNEKFAVATLDKDLRKKIKDLGIKVIYLRNKKYLSID